MADLEISDSKAALSAMSKKRMIIDQYSYN